MPARDSIHNPVKAALVKAGWLVTADPYVISYGERFLFVDLGAESGLIGAVQGNSRIAIEIKELRGRSIIAELEQAIGQYVLYQLLLTQVDPERAVYLAITTEIYDNIFQEPLGQLVLRDLPLKLVVVNIELQEVSKWIPSPFDL
jgi:XisH protein